MQISATATLAPLDAEARAELFDDVWGLVQERYLYADYRRVDWDAIRASYRPQIAAAANPATAYDLLAAMIDELGDEHSRFDNPQQVASESAQSRGTLLYGGIGVQVRTDTAGALITRVGLGSPAEAAGIMPHDLIVAINHHPISDTVAFGNVSIEEVMRGPPGTSVQVSVVSAGGPPREFTLTRQVIGGDAFPPVEARRLPGTRTGLLRIDTFDRENLATLVRDKVDDLLAEGPLDGIILDVRDNGGGYITALLDTLALFIDGGSIGSSASRQNREDLEIPGGVVAPGTEGIPLAVLINAGTASAAEMFAAGVRVRERGTLVGEATAGNTENLVLHTLPGGSRLWLAEYAYRMPNGELIEEVGIKPDIAIAADWWRYDPAVDPQVQAALRVFKTARS